MNINRFTRHRLETWLPYLLIILMAIAIISFQITHHFFINGIDTFFHMSIAYDTARQIKTGNFSWFLSPYGFYHSLRIVNAVYGPLGGYFSGLLLIILGSWIRWEIAIFFIVFMIAGVSMYQLCRYWDVTMVYSILLSGLYMLSFPIMSMWLNTQYDGLGAAFIPWVLYFGSMIINRDDFQDWKLIVLLIILAEIHVFSMLLSLLVLGMCYVFSMIFNSGTRKVITVKAFKVLAWTVALAFNVWGSILEVLRSNSHKIIPTYSFNNMFANIWSAVRIDCHVPVSQNLFLLGLSTTILLIIVMVLYLLMARHLNWQLNFIMIGLGLLFLWLASRYFPWPILQRQFPILDTDLQFPKRFLPVSLTAFNLVLGVLLTKLQRKLSNTRFWAIVFAVILGMFVLHAWQNTQYQAQYLYHEQGTAKYYNQTLHQSTGDGWLTKHPLLLRASLRGRHPGRYFRVVTKTTPDYMPTNQNLLNDAQYHKLNAYNRYFSQVVQNKLKYHYRYAHHVMTVSFARKSPKPITVPFVKYRHTVVTMNGKPLTHPKLTTIGAVNVRPRPGKNVMTFTYQTAKWYTTLMWLSLLAWLWFVCRIVLNYKE